MNKFKKMMGPFLYVPVVIGILSYVMLASSSYGDVNQSVTYIAIILVVLGFVDGFSKKNYVLSQSNQLKKRAQVYLGLALFISVFAVVFSEVNELSQFSVDFTLYLVYRIVFYTSLLYIFYYLNNERKRLS